MIPPLQSSQFVANMERVLYVYKLQCNEDYPVVCMDESPKQLIQQIASIAMKPGQKTRFDYEYIRYVKTHDASAFHEAFEPEEEKKYGIDLSLFFLPSIVIG